jgi:hypothetical protein
MKDAGERRCVLFCREMDAKRNPRTAGGMFERHRLDPVTFEPGFQLRTCHVKVVPDMTDFDNMKHTATPKTSNQDILPSPLGDAFELNQFLTTECR